MTTLAFIDTAHSHTRTDEYEITRLGLALVRVHDDLWRITRTDGDVLGYVERFEVRDGLRYRAKRYIARQSRFVSMGEFWGFDSAVDCF
jgi:hypothetical protein